MTPAEEHRQHLTGEDSGLALVLAAGRRSASPAFACVLGAFLVAGAGGLLLFALGAELRAPVLTLASGLIVVAVPVLRTALSRRNS
ncbi:hypothetical protein [Amycolatopsis sp. NPDC004169]|uniref:hypothetical protein n=1 Tax=Amycolatopsis sp. NPDC004169 TaxID=3154453 RepID=UPI0033A5DAEE